MNKSSANPAADKSSLAVSASVLPCPKCRAALPEESFNREEPSPCPACGCQVQSLVFPTFFTGPRIGHAGAQLMDAADASCFFHPDKQAVITCESCGRFLCSLCDLEFGARHICPNCLSSGQKKGTLGNYDHFRLSWSGVALAIAVGPPFVLVGFAPFNLAFGIVAIVVALIGLKKPRSMTGRRRYITFSLAMLIGLAETVALILFGGKLAKTFYGV